MQTPVEDQIRKLRADIRRLRLEYSRNCAKFNETGNGYYYDEAHKLKCEIADLAFDLDQLCRNKNLPKIIVTKKCG